jgi:hypothetical protein
VAITLKFTALAPVHCLLHRPAVTRHFALIVVGTAMVISASAVVLHGCRSESEPVLTECPPAPLRSTRDLPKACALPRQCNYQPPRIDGRAGGYCNWVTIDCEDGGTRAGITLIGCYGTTPPICKQPIVEGAHCDDSFHDGGGDYFGYDNKECLVPENGTDVSASSIKGKACACDAPGPIWRCTEATWESSPPPFDAGPSDG